MGTINGTPGNDVIHGTHGTDTIIAGAGNDTVYAYSSNDVLQGEAGNDYLWGGPGRDVMQGGDGNDILDGGTGYDSYSGGVGSDVFKFSNTGFDYGSLSDFIQRFESGKDKIDLSGIDANTALAGDQAFWFNNAGTGRIPHEFQGLAGELIFRANWDKQGLICGDVNADKIADFCIVCTSAAAKLLLMVSDFIL